jgi:hypothetical protein
MEIGDFLKPSFALDRVGIRKNKNYEIVERDEIRYYVRTDFKLLFPVHENKIVEQSRFNEESEQIRSDTWLHIAKNTLEQNAGVEEIEDVDLYSFRNPEKGMN